MIFCVKFLISHILSFGQEFDLSENRLDLQKKESIESYAEFYCSYDEGKVVGNVTAKENNSLSIQHGVSGNVTILINGEDLGQKICFDMARFREFTIRQANNETSWFEMLVGHLLVQNRYNKKFGLMFTDSNIGDRGAVDTLNIWFLKFLGKI